MEHQIIREEGAVRICPICERLETATARSFRDMVREACHPDLRELEIDLSQIQFIDGSGIASLLSLFHIFDHTRGSIILSHPQPPVQRLLQLLRLDRIFLIRT